MSAKYSGLQLFIVSKEKLELGGVTQVCNLHTRVTEAGQFRVQGQRGLYGENLSQRRGRGKWGGSGRSLLGSQVRKEVCPLWEFLSLP